MLDKTMSYFRSIRFKLFAVILVGTSVGKFLILEHDMFF